MRKMLGMCLGITLLLGANVVNAEESLQGTWKLSSGEAHGKALSEKQLHGGKLVINGDHYTVTIEGRGTATGVQKLDPKAKTIDITDNAGAHKGETCLGIYEVKGHEFRVAFAAPGKARPSKFSTTAESGTWVHTWKRVKE